MARVRGYRIATVSSHEFESLVEAALEVPRPGSTGPSYGILIQGWVLSSRGPVTRVRVSFEHDVLRELPQNLPRPDVLEAFPEHVHGESSGFRTGVSLLGLPRRAVLLVEVEVAGEFVDAWEVTVERELLASPASNVRPIALTTLGRTGSTLAASLLAAHPDVAAYPPWRGEPRFLTYWLSVIDELATPTNYLKPLMPPPFTQRDWWHDDPAYAVPYAADDAILELLGRDGVERTVAHAREQLVGLYRGIAGLDGARAPIYFLEKFLPDAQLTRLAFEAFPDMRQIVLVRDFRDMFASILAMDEKRGYYGFGRLNGESEEDYALRLGASVRLLAAVAQEWDSHTFVLRYEDLVNNPYETVASMFDALDLAATPRMIERTVAGGMKRTEDSDAHRTIDDADATIRRWERDLSPGARAACEAAFGDGLAAFGYTQ